MNFLKIFLIVGLLFFPFLLHSQISNIELSNEGNQIIITYDYAIQDKSIDVVKVTYTTDDKSGIKEAKQVSGDVQGISPGKGKRIVWEPLREMASFSAENLVVYLDGFRDEAKQLECDNNLKLANNFFADKSYENAQFYYSELFNCLACNCNRIDLIYATNQINKIKTIMGIKDRYFASYLFDMATAKDGNNMYGASFFLLRDKIGYYASFRSDKNFYYPQNNMQYYQEDKDLQNNYDLNYLDNSRISSWLFSSGITYKIGFNKYISPFLYGGIGLGSNSIAGEYNVTESGYSEKVWISDGIRNMFVSPEAGIIANIGDYFSLMTGVKYPLSITSNKDLITKGFSAMFGIGVQLKALDKNDYRRANTYVAYVFDMPEKSSPDKIQSTNFIGFSAGTISYSKVGGYFSLRINPLLFNNKQETKLTENTVFTGVYDYANAFSTAGLTWMCFYSGVGVSYQKEYKVYDNAGEEVWNSQRSKVGLCTEFGVNLRLFDKLLLRGGVTFPDFSLSNQSDEFTMGSNKMYFTLGIGYVLPITK